MKLRDLNARHAWLGVGPEMGLGWLEARTGPTTHFYRRMDWIARVLQGYRRIVVEGFRQHAMA